jgi:hypothetical protein
MPKRPNVQASKSPFSAILGRHPQAHGIAPAGTTPRPDRKQGKSTNPAYTQLTAYIRKETHQAVKVRLIQQGQGREFSELVQELLDGWLKE